MSNGIASLMELVVEITEVGDDNGAWGWADGTNDDGSERAQVWL